MLSWANLCMGAMIGSCVLMVGKCSYDELGFNEELNTQRATEKKQEQEQAVANSKPRMVSSDGACEVWAFLPQGGARWLYFSRCDAKTTTFNQWKECRTVTSGKTSRQECTEHQTEIDQVTKP